MKVESYKTIIKKSYRYSEETRLYALANMLAEKEVDIPTQPLPVYIPPPKQKWSRVNLYAVFHKLLP